MAMPKGDRRGRRRGALEGDDSATCETLKLLVKARWERRPGDQPPTRWRQDGCADGRSSGFKSQQDAQRTLELLHERMGQYGLKLHPDKTRLIPIAQPANGASGGKGPGTFDFLGFTLYWMRTRSGRWSLRMKTRKARLQRALKALGEFCRRQRHDALKEQHAALTRRLQGHFNYFGVNGNLRTLSLLLQEAKRTWRKWLNRRSQRTRLTWERFRDFLAIFPLPAPTIRVRIWAT